MSSPPPRSTVVAPASSGEDLRTASVRVRRRATTVSSRPPNLEPILSGQQSSAALQQSPLTRPAETDQDRSSSPAPAPAPPTNPPQATPGRRRALTISQRLQTAEADDSASSLPDQTAVQGRRRSATVGSASSRTRRVRQRSPSPVPGGAEVTTIEDHDQDEVDLLEVLDQRVSTAVALNNITSAFWPSRFTSPPVVELDEPAAEAQSLIESDSGDSGGGIKRSKTIDELEMELLIAEEQGDPLAAHLAVVLKKQRRKEKTHGALLGIWSFLKTPLGVAAAIYGLNVVVWGAGLVLLLMIPMNAYDKKLWVEICSQVLTGLFHITSLLPLPWRLYDAYQVSIIYSYQRRTRERRKQLGLAPLRDPNDLPEPEDADYWVGPGGERLTGPRPLPTVQPVKEKKSKTKKGSKDATPANATPSGTEPGTPTAEHAHDVELAAMETKVGASPVGDGTEDEMPVLTDKEEERLRRAQLKFGRSQNWYRAHSSPTHHAFPISQALLITLFTLTNSLFQIALCGAMYGLNRFNRPAPLTACLIVGSFMCGIVAAVLIWQCGERTKKKAEVSRRVWMMLKKDEAELLARKKEAMAARVAQKHEKSAHKAGLAGVLGRISMDGQRREDGEGVKSDLDGHRIETVKE